MDSSGMRILGLLLIVTGAAVIVTAQVLLSRWQKRCKGRDDRALRKL